MRQLLQFRPLDVNDVSPAIEARDFPSAGAWLFAAIALAAPLAGGAPLAAGTSARNRFPEGLMPEENNCSLGFRLTYASFQHFNGGDMRAVTDVANRNAPAWTEMESAMAWVCGPVDVQAVNHRGTPDVANAFFLSVLQPRVHIMSIYASSQPGPEVLRRLLSESIYPGPRDVFMTNWLWPGRNKHMVKHNGEKGAA